MLQVNIRQVDTNEKNDSVSASQHLGCVRKLVHHLGTIPQVCQSLVIMIKDCLANALCHISSGGQGMPGNYITTDGWDICWDRPCECAHNTSW